MDSHSHAKTLSRLCSHGLGVDPDLAEASVFWGMGVWGEYRANAVTAEGLLKPLLWYWSSYHGFSVVWSSAFLAACEVVCFLILYGENYIFM